MFAAHKGIGAYCNNSRIRVSNKSNFQSACLVTGGPKSTSKAKESILEEYKKISMKTNAHIRKSGSAALDLAYVAAGRYDGFWENGLNQWDVAAGLLLVREAGGFVTDLRGLRYELGADNILATNEGLHHKLSKILVQK